MQATQTVTRADAMTAPPAIRTIGLSKRFKNTVAVRDVALNVQQGDVFGLLGPNGAGKTTIIRLLLGLVTPTAGRAEILGYDVQRDKDETAKRVGAIIESPALYPMLTGRENLQAIATLARVSDPQMIDSVLGMVGLAARANDKARTYSLGMKQRLAIASTLLADPQIVILDEPTNGLDAQGMTDIRHFIRDLAAQGRTVFLSSHLLHEVQQVCNRVAVLQRGQVVVQGLVSDLLAGQTTIRVRLSVADIPNAVAALTDTGWAGRVRNDGDSLVVDGAATDGADINRALVAHGLYAAEITPQGLSLEEYYLRLTNSPAAHAGAPMG